MSLRPDLQEHLFLVCELLRANLYEFQKHNREQGQDPYFTVPRVQSIARQVKHLVCCCNSGRISQVYMAKLAGPSVIISWKS